ncbi:MAG: LysM peptidoglycan-binding domain-containing protein [Actinomycetota bacterium]|nr:LysM peptidoglycan-binding domain-containing protein [Actinomycetota bacterium]
MSVATDFPPAVYVPSRARQSGPRDATILRLLAPSEQSIAAPVRLTRRGVLVVALALAVLSIGLIGLAWLSAPSAPASAQIPASVAVRDGDTLWSIASRLAPGRDPRSEIAELLRVNHLSGVGLTAGEVLRTR